VTISPRAVVALEKRSTKVRSWYLDLTMVRSYWGQDRAYHHTAPINMNFGLHEALRIVLEEGLEQRFARHLSNHRALKAGLQALGVNYAVAEPHQLPMLNSVLIPGGVDDLAVRKQLLSEFGIEIGSGLGALKGKTWRIGLMGETSTQSNVLLFLAALERCLTNARQNIAGGAGVAAANASFGMAQK
jgi:alanine-glyoxylate transaminase/serine-glyoxylate transaminase/serine-pyruvate transaminase